jgi:hypothetical protein
MSHVICTCNTYAAHVTTSSRSPIIYSKPNRMRTCARHVLSILQTECALRARLNFAQQKIATMARQKLATQHSNQSSARVQRPSLSSSRETIIFQAPIRIDTMKGCQKSVVLETKEHLLWMRASVVRTVGTYTGRQLPSLRLEP